MPLEAKLSRRASQKPLQGKGGHKLCRQVWGRERGNMGVLPLSPESFPSPIFYSPIFAFKTSIASSMPAGFVPPA